MIRNFDEEGLFRLWQDDDAAPASLPLDEIKHRARRFGEQVHKRNRREYIASAIVAGAFAIYAVILPGFLLKIGSLMMIAGIVVVVWQLSHRTSRPESTTATTDVRTHYRARLVVEEQMLASVGRWYLGPLLPGLIVFMVGQAAVTGHLDPLGITFYITVPASLFGGIWWLNRRAAAMLRRQIDRLDKSAARFEGGLE